MMEILVVIAVLLVLAALTTAAVNVVIESGRRARCAHGLRQAGFQIAEATARNGFQLPSFYSVRPQGNGYKIFTQPPPKRSSDIGAYVEAPLLRCPSDKKPTLIDTKDAAGNDADWAVSYGFNFIPSLLGARTIDLDASRTLLMFDGKYDQSAQQGLWNGDAGDINRFNTDLGVARHHKKMNVYFLDGHIEVLKSLPSSGVFAQ
jgi:prepilin-type processing-associated H-X9-DG protein